jgi:hypothetical protein
MFVICKYIFFVYCKCNKTNSSTPTIIWFYIMQMSSTHLHIDHRYTIVQMIQMDLSGRWHYLFCRRKIYKFYDKDLFWCEKKHLNWIRFLIPPFIRNPHWIEESLLLSWTKMGWSSDIFSTFPKCYKYIYIQFVRLLLLSKESGSITPNEDPGCEGEGTLLFSGDFVWMAAEIKDLFYIFKR